MQVNVQFLQQKLQTQKGQRFVTIVKQSEKIDTVSYHKLFDILKQFQLEVNDIRAERIAKSANPLALIAALKNHRFNNYHKQPKPQRSKATTSDKRKMQKNLPLLAKYFKSSNKPTNNNHRKLLQTQRTRLEIPTPRSGSANRLVYSALNCKGKWHYAKECRKPKRKDYAYHKEKMMIVQTKLNKGMEAHYSYMQKIQEVSPEEVQFNCSHCTVLDQKHDDLVKKSLLTKSQLEGYLKENTKDISDLQDNITLLVLARPQLRSYQVKDKTPHKKIVASDTTYSKSPRVYNKELYENTKSGMGNWGGIAKENVLQVYTWTQKPPGPKDIELRLGKMMNPTSFFQEIYLFWLRDLQGNLLVLLSHLNFDYITLLSKKDVVTGLPKLTYVKDQLCSSCEMSKAKRSSFKSKAVPSSKGRLNLLHMDLCGPMRVASINGKKYILVIVDDYSRYTWTLFLRSKDETPEVLKDFLTMIQRNLQAQVITVRTDRGTEFLNKTLHAYFKEEGIEHQTSTPRTPEQNGVVERRNRTLVEAARTMLSASKLPLSFWAEAVATACYTQNRSIIISTHGKTAYHIINDRKPSIKHLHIFGCTCYITRDGENLDKMKEKGDPCVMVGYSTQSKGYRVYNKRTRLIVESIHIKFDEIKEMMSDHNSSDLAPQRQEMSVENVSSGLVPQGQKASDYDNSDPVECCSYSREDRFVTTRVGISLQSFT
ncbi:retrovirus-related pol polyprotein from transposon TNT 1-94 [Tanacetum coccineum]